jgi:hypothetical protein
VSVLVSHASSPISHRKGQGEGYDNVPKARRQLGRELLNDISNLYLNFAAGLFSASFLIFNRVIGTGLVLGESIPESSNM